MTKEEEKWKKSTGVRKKRCRSRTTSLRVGVGGMVRDRGHGKVRGGLGGERGVGRVQGGMGRGRG